jgi:predicted alpha/beta hydrolase family esterase
MASIIIVPGWRDSGPGHWQSLWADQLPGAVRVAPADPERRGILADFAPVPCQPLPYRSIMVASSNDPFCPVRTAGAYARAWGSEFVRLQNAGHINIESGFGAWPLGLALLQSLTGEGSFTNNGLSPFSNPSLETA